MIITVSKFHMCRLVLNSSVLNTICPELRMALLQFLKLIDGLCNPNTSLSLCIPSWAIALVNWEMLEVLLALFFNTKISQSMVSVC